MCEMKDLIYPSAYHAMKSGPCRIGVCNHNGECEKCPEYGDIRCYVARDADIIAKLRSLVKELADNLMQYRPRGYSDPLIVKAMDAIGGVPQ